MVFDTLNELIAMPKKAETSKAKKKLFVEQMGILLAEEGFSQTAIDYLKSGFTFMGAKPIAIYLQQKTVDARASEITELLTSKLFRGGDNLTAFRFGISLSAYSIELFGEDQQLLAELIKVLPSVSINKEKQPLKDAPKIFEKYFLDIVSESTKLPRLDDLGIKDIYLREFRAMVAKIANKVSPAYRAKASRIEEWISTGTSHNAQSTNSEKESSASNSKVSNEPRSSHCDIPQKEAKALSTRELMNVSTILGELSARLKATVNSWSATRTELDAAKKQISSLEAKLQQYESQIENEARKYAQIVAELDNRAIVIEDLQIKIAKANQVIARQGKQIEELVSENARLNSIISVYSSDKESSQSEQLNSIASKLKSEYRDFMDAENEEMTLDLGENLRFQIKSIFRILAKAGIDVERR